MVIHYNHMMLICFEAYKIHNQGFSEILRHTLIIIDKRVGSKTE